MANIEIDTWLCILCGTDNNVKCFSSESDLLNHHLSHSILDIANSVIKLQRILRIAGLFEEVLEFYCNPDSDPKDLISKVTKGISIPEIAKEDEITEVAFEDEDNEIAEIDHRNETATENETEPQVYHNESLELCPDDDVEMNINDSSDVTTLQDQEANSIPLEELSNENPSHHEIVIEMQNDTNQVQTEVNEVQNEVIEVQNDITEPPIQEENESIQMENPTENVNQQSDSLDIKPSIEDFAQTIETPKTYLENPEPRSESSMEDVVSDSPPVEAEIPKVKQHNYKMVDCVRCFECKEPVSIDDISEHLKLKHKQTGKIECLDN